MPILLLQLLLLLLLLAWLLLALLRLRLPLLFARAHLVAPLGGRSAARSRRAARGLAAARVGIGRS